MDLAARTSEFMGGFAHRYPSNPFSLNITMTQFNTLIFVQFTFDAFPIQWDGRWLSQLGAGSPARHPGAVAPLQRILPPRRRLLTWRWTRPAVHQVRIKDEDLHL